MKFLIQPTENSRLLSLKKIWGDNLGLATIEWSEVVSKLPEVKIPNEDVYLYFFKSPLKSEFKKTPFWYSRQIIGFAPKDDAYQLLDLDEGETWETNEFEFKNYNELEAYGVEAFKEASKQGLSVADSWCVKLREESLCHKASIRCFYEKRPL
ncbi:MAG: hypothetical protein KC493_12510 [Bacteriovoracaceae bacterium]|nr:hypothetical protein [Bacteriovoracaceae bacterium]